MRKPNRLRPSLEESVFVELARTTDLLARRPGHLLKEGGLSPAQYNVLRILRGAPEGLLCGEIAERMITREPDITRLLDRMERRDLLARHRDQADRRRVLVRITSQGLSLLSRLDAPLQQVHRQQLGHLAPKRLQALLRELQACRRKLP